MHSPCRPVFPRPAASLGETRLRALFKPIREQTAMTAERSATLTQRGWPIGWFAALECANFVRSLPGKWRSIFQQG